MEMHSNSHISQGHLSLQDIDAGAKESLVKKTVGILMNEFRQKAQNEMPAWLLQEDEISFAQKISDQLKS